MDQIFRMSCPEPSGQRFLRRLGFRGAYHASLRIEGSSVMNFLVKTVFGMHEEIAGAS
jgi:hypothetical protein